MTQMRQKSPSRERGVALVMVLAVMSVLLLAGIIGVGVFMGGLRITGQDIAAKRALFCSEAGLAAGRNFFGTDYANWDAYLACNVGATCPGYPLLGYADPANSRYRYSVRIIDNIDEPVPNPAHDNDLTVIVESTCVEPGLPPQPLQQIVSLRPSAGGSTYRQAGGWNGTNNQP